MKRFFVIFKTEFLMFVRDFFGFFFTFAFPVLMLVIFGGIYGNEELYPGAGVGVMDISVPAYCVMVIGVTGLMAFPLTLAEYKEKKIYKRFDATPAGKRSIITAQVLVNVLMTFVGFAILLTAGVLIYRVKIDGAPVSIILAMLISVISIFSIGFFFTAVARDSKITNLLCYLSYFVMIFLSGATMPKELFPETIKTISSFLPMTYAVDLMQGIFKGNTFTEHITELVVLFVISAVCIGAGAFLYRKKSWS